MSQAAPPPPLPPQRAVSPIGSKFRLFQSTRARNMTFGVVGVAIVVLIVLGVEAAITDPGPEARKRDDGPIRIAQEVPTPPVNIERPAPASAPAIVAQSTPPAAQAAAAAPPPNVVRFPSASGGIFFDVPPPQVQPAKAPENNPAESQRLAAATTQVAFKPTIIPGGKAGAAMDLKYVMLPQIIPCALDSAMDSTIAGAIMLHTTADVLSPAPYNIPLMWNGTRVVGTYRNDIPRGQSRLYGLSGYAITREGIPVPLDSQIGDGLARNGIPGNVDHHIGERFGAALALTGVDQTLQLLQTELSKPGQSSFNIGGGGNGVSGIASQILQDQIRIPDTISVPSGAQCSLIIDHPIDFSDAIRVEAYHAR